MSRRCISLLVVLGCLFIPAWSSAGAAGPTTVERTILDSDADNRLGYAAGENHVVRQDLANALPGRLWRHYRRLYLGHLSDFQYPDEEAPLRFERLDPVHSAFAGAYRPEEALAGQVVGSMAYRLTGIESPVDRRFRGPPDNFVVTGDSADSNQLNETRDYIDILDGGSVDPDSGVIGLCALAGGWAGPFGNWIKRYAGVRGGGEYYEPAASGAGVDGPGYSPDEGENFAETGHHVALRDFMEGSKDLLEQAQLPFESTGLDAPWYAAMGNHDGLIQGNIPNDLLGDLFDIYNTGCFKALSGARSTPALKAFDRAYREHVKSPSQATAQALAGRLVTAYGSPIAKDAPDGIAIVPEDPDRRYLSAREWADEHFQTAGTPVGHGFADRPSPDQQYYSVSPKPGIRYIGLNSVNDDGLSNGRIDDEQFQWLEAQLQQSRRAAELVIVFAHHTLATMDNGLDLSPLEGDYHFGLRGQAGNPPHDHGESLEELFLRYPNAIAYVAGHEHDNKVTPYALSTSPGAFWEIDTAAHIDWPGQSRLIELYDNRDGTLSIFATMVDHAAKPDPGDAPDLDRPGILASIARELTWNDYQAATGEEPGQADARGTPEDRNVELLIAAPSG